MAGNIVLTGRAKDTIVLSNGKNVEPQPIEDACQAAPLIKYMVLVGQDKRELVRWLAGWVIEHSKRPLPHLLAYSVLVAVTPLLHSTL